MNAVRLALLSVAASLAVLSVPAHSYVAKITKSDILAGGGRCAGNLCTINGRMYDCTGSGYCTIIQS